MLIVDFIEKFLDQLKSHRGYSDHTIRNYRIDLKQFLIFLIEEERLSGKGDRSPDLNSIDFSAQCSNVVRNFKCCPCSITTFSSHSNSYFFKGESSGRSNFK